MTNHDRAYTTTDSPTGTVHLLHFRDRRAFHEIQFALERNVMVLFAPSLEHGTLHARAAGHVNGARYQYELTLHAAQLFTNACSLRAEGTWGHFGAEHDAYFRQASHSWFQLWTSDLSPAKQPARDDTGSTRYRKQCEEALRAEAHLDSVDAIQRAILDGLERGGRYVSSHKEGGSHIGWRQGAFHRSDYGDNPRDETFTDPATFLTMLEQFCHWDVRQANGEDISDIDRWRLIWRRMHAA